MRASRVVLALAALVLASAGGAAERVRGSIDRTPSCRDPERRADGITTVTLTLVTLEGWPEADAIAGLASCAADEVGFDAAWDEPRAQRLRATLEAAGIVEDALDGSGCASALEALCGAGGGVAEIRFEGSAPALDRCTGTCADGGAVRAFAWRVTLARR